MALLNRIGKTSIKDESDRENAIAEAKQNKARIDYLAMMCDVEFPGESNNMEEEEEREDA